MALNLIGGFQSNAVKAKWAEDATEECPLCTGKDHRYHQMIECPALQSIRESHSEAVHILKEVFPDWIYHPFLPSTPQKFLLKHVLGSFDHIPPCSVPQEPQTYHTYFTDGACK